MFILFIIKQIDDKYGDVYRATPVINEYYTVREINIDALMVFRFKLFACFGFEFLSIKTQKNMKPSDIHSILMKVNLL